MFSIPSENKTNNNSNNNKNMTENYKKEKKNECKQKLLEIRRQIKCFYLCKQKLLARLFFFFVRDKASLS